MPTSIPVRRLLQNAGVIDRDPSRYGAKDCLSTDDASRVRFLRSALTGAEGIALKRANQRKYDDMERELTTLLDKAAN